MDIFTVLENDAFVFYTAVFSVIFFIMGAFLAPYIILKVPYDYFAYATKKSYFLNKKEAASYYTKMIIRNIIALIVFFLGVIMLVMPGQGLLTIMIALIMADIPGKYKIEKRIIKNRGVYTRLNRFREKYGKKPFVIP